MSGLKRLLRLALESFERYDEVDALERLLKAWRKKKAGRLAELAEQLSPVTPPGAEPRELVAILQTLLDSMRGLDGHAVEPREGLADPRSTPALLALVGTPLAREEKVLDLLCETFFMSGDPRALEPLRALLESLPHGSRKADWRGFELMNLPAQEVPTLDAEVSAFCDALEQGISRRVPLRDALLARLGARLDDDDARLVLADSLLEQGDSLGELIALQCQPEPDTYRVQELLRQHEVRWARWPGKVRVERGLPAAVTLRAASGWYLAPPGALWRAVREIDWNWTGDEAHAAWLAHPNLGGVTVLRQVSSAMAHRLGRYPLPVRRLGLGGLFESGPERLFNSLAALPHLVQVELFTFQSLAVQRCVESPLAGRLERFEMVYPGVGSLVANPRAEVPVEASLVNAQYGPELEAALRAAVRFGTRALRLHTAKGLGPDVLRGLERAAAGYARVEWARELDDARVPKKEPPRWRPP